MIPFGFILRIINLNSSNASGSSLIVLHALCHIPHPAILCPAIIPDLTSVLFDGLRPSLLLNVCSRGVSVCAAGTSPSHQGFLYLSLKSPSLLYVPRPLRLLSPPTISGKCENFNRPLHTLCRNRCAEPPVKDLDKYFNEEIGIHRGSGH